MAAGRRGLALLHDDLVVTMSGRTREMRLTFKRPFVLDGLDETLPPGTYRVETDEELLDGVSFAAYRRVRAMVHLHAEPGHPGVARTLVVEPGVLDAAVRRDDAPEGEQSPS